MAGQTVIEPSPEQTAETAAGAANRTPSSPTAGTGTAPPADKSGGTPTWLYIVGGALVVLLLAVGVWAVFLRDSGGGEEPPIAGIEPTEYAGHH